MAADFQDFVTPEQEFKGLYAIGDTVAKQREREQRKAAGLAQAQQEAKTKKDASVKFFANYLDKKDKFTGTNYDPKKFELVDNTLAEAMSLIEKGASESEIMTSIQPKLATISKYDAVSQKYAADKKAILAELGKQKGIDINKVSEVMDEMAFYDIDPTTGERKEKEDYLSINPSGQYWADLALREGDVYSSEGFDEFADKAQKTSSLQSVKTVDEKGKTVFGKAEIEGQGYLVPEYDGKDFKDLVPKYTIATDAGNEHIKEWQTDNGAVAAPIRLLDEDVFKSLQPKQLAYVRQEARKYAKEQGMKLDSQQVENLAKAIAYDELNSPTRKSKKTKFISEQREAKAPTTNVSVKVGGKGTGDVTINDVFSTIDAVVEADRAKGKKATRMNALDLESKNVVLDLINKGKAADKMFTGDEDVILHKDNKGVLKVYKAELVDEDNPAKGFVINESTEIGGLTPKGVNLKAQTSVKPKQAVVEKGNPITRALNKVWKIINPKTNKVVMEVKSEEEMNKAKQKGYKIQ